MDLWVSLDRKIKNEIDHTLVNDISVMKDVESIFGLSGKKCSQGQCLLDPASSVGGGGSLHEDTIYISETIFNIT